MTTDSKITAFAFAMAAAIIIGLLWGILDQLRAIREHYDPPAKVQFRWTPSQQSMEPETLVL